MRIRIKRPASIIVRPGVILELDELHGKRLIHEGAAELIETADLAQPVETAAKKTRKKTTKKEA